MDEYEPVASAHHAALQLGTVSDKNSSYKKLLATYQGVFAFWNIF